VALTDEQEATLRRLRTRLDRDLRTRRHNGHLIPGFRALEAYAEGQQRLVQLGIAVPEDLREFITIVDWPGSYVDAIASRLRPQGFLVGGVADDDLWATWQANRMDSEIRMGLHDMLTFGRGYLAAGTAEEDSAEPLITVESPLQMIHEWSNRHRRVTAAARFYVDDSGAKKEARATLLEANVTTWLVRYKGRWVEDGQPDEHGVGRVLVNPLVNRASTHDRYGKSEMLRIIGLTDAAARALTNAQIATEVVALPQKWAAGMSQADFKDPKTGELLTQWEAYIGSVWATSKEGAKFGQFSAADLSNFKTIVGLYAQLASGVTGLPMRYFGQLSDNPPSADGIRADEARLVGTAEDKQTFADDAIEGTMRDASRIKNGEDDPKLLQMETRWRNAATPTVSQSADSAVKLFAAGVISKKQARTDMGYTPQQITAMEEQDANELVDPVVAALLKDARVNAVAGA
jgi:hypothetical protein